METLMTWALPVWLAAANLAALVLFAVDKGRARRGLWRIPERTLFLAALLGGSLGAILGMVLLRHKTRHWTFRLGLPAILVLQVGLGLWLARTMGVLTLW